MKKSTPKWGWTPTCWRRELACGVKLTSLFRTKKEAVGECEKCHKEHKGRCHYRLRNLEPKKLVEG